MTAVAMPRLSDSMEEGTILKWLKSDGDEVSKGEELVEIETDKANMTYESDVEGTLRIVAGEGDTLAVGETIARIGAGGGDDAPSEAPEAKGEQEEQARTTAARVRVMVRRRRIGLTCRARRTASRSPSVRRSRRRWPRRMSPSRRAMATAG